MDMSDGMRDRARQNYSAVLKALAEVSQKRVADLLNLSETGVSTYKSDHLERACQMIAACGLRIVPTTEHSYEEEDIAALRRLALKGLAHITPKRGVE